MAPCTFSVKKNLTGSVVWTGAKSRKSGKSRAKKTSTSDGGFVRRRSTARIIVSSDESGCSAADEDDATRNDAEAAQEEESFDVSDSELAGIDLEFIAQTAAANSWAT